MSHDIEASYAATEIVANLLAAPATCFSKPPASGLLSGYAAREGRHTWPHADGVVELSVPTSPAVTSYSLALEFKRANEGLHGVLTAIGQSHSYLHKGYAGAIIVIPDRYAGFEHPGTYVKEVLELTSKSQAIGVYTYSRPDFSAVSPFAGKLQLHKSLSIDATPPIVAPVPLSRTETQWAHIREGSTDPDAFFKYLQAVKLLSGGDVDEFVPIIPPPLASAVSRLRGGASAEKYLSNCPNDSLADKAWRQFWFKCVLHPEAINGWVEYSPGTFVVNQEASRIYRSDGAGRKKFFVGRADSIKHRLVSELSSASITIDIAYEQLAENYFKRAHSYREDIDSGCEHLGFVNSDGRLTDIGYRFVDACERYGNPNEGLPRAVFLKALLDEGALGAFIHYVHRLSEEKFRVDPLAFTAPTRGTGSIPRFVHADYLDWIEGEMQNRLHVIRKVSLRGGASRRPFQAELAVLRSLGIVEDFRLGVGLVINWPALQDAVSFSGQVQ